MSDQQNNELRLVEVDGARRLARDFAKHDGTPVAVIGPNTVTCTRCQAKPLLRCVDPRGIASEYPHLERIALMNNEIDRLLREAGEK